MPKNVVGTALPQYLKKYFWDVDFKSLTSEDSWFIINRLLEHADEAGVRYMLRSFRQTEIIDVLVRSRSLSNRSRNFWKLYFRIKEDICIRKQYPTPYGDYSH